MSWFSRSRKHWFWKRVYFYGFFIVMFFLFKSWIERHLVFHPTSAREYWDSPPSPSVEEITVPISEGNSVHAWWLPCPKDDWHLVLFHGNGGNLSLYGSRLLRNCLELNASTLIFDYPGYGKSTGAPTEASCYEAAESVIRTQIENGRLDPAKLVYWGESLGGGVAVEIAGRIPPKALILFKTFTSLPAAAKNLYPFLPTSSLMYFRFDNLQKIGNLKMPVFIVSAKSDRIVPHDQGQELFDAANEPKEFLSIAGDHNEPMPENLIPRIHQFLQKHP